MLLVVKRPFTTRKPCRRWFRGPRETGIRRRDRILAEILPCEAPPVSIQRKKPV